MGVGACRRAPEPVGDGGVRRRHGAADDRRTRRRVGAVGGSPAHAELEHRSSARRLDDPCRLGGDQGGEVELVEQRRLQQLRGGERALDDGDRRVRMDDATLGHGVEAKSAEVDVNANQSRKASSNSAAAGSGAVTAQRLDVGRRGVRRRHPLGERREAGGDAVPGLVLAVVRVRAEEVLESDRPLVQPDPDVQLGHRQLVGVGAEEPPAKHRLEANGGYRDADGGCLRPRHGARGGRRPERLRRSGRLAGRAGRHRGDRRGQRGDHRGDGGRCPVVYTQDWHPPRTLHFVTDGGPWPVHCVRDTRGAQFHSTSPSSANWRARAEAARTATPASRCAIR